MKNQSLLWSLFLNVLLVSAAYGQQAKLVSSSTGAAQRIKGLKFDSDRVDVRVTEDGPQVRTVAVLKGKFQQPDAYLLCQDKPVPVEAAPDRESFEITVPLEGRVTPVLMTTIDRSGNISTEDYVIVYAEYSARRSVRKEPPRLDLSAGLAGTYFTYSEARRNLNVQQMGLTAKAGLLYRIIRRTLHGDLTAFGTLVTFGITPSGTPDSKYLGLNGRLGYRVPLGLGAAESFFLAGWYRWAMSVPGNAYGVNPLEGPQLFLQVSMAEEGARPYYGYMKLATISDSGDFLQLQNYEIAFGAGLGLSADLKPLFGTLDIAKTQFSKGRNSMTLITFSAGVTQRF